MTRGEKRIEMALAELGADATPPAGWEGRVEAAAALERLQSDIDFLEKNTVAVPYEGGAVAESWANVRLEIVRIGAALRAAGAVLVLVLVALAGACADDPGPLDAEMACRAQEEVSVPGDQVVERWTVAVCSRQDECGTSSFEACEAAVHAQLGLVWRLANASVTDEELTACEQEIAETACGKVTGTGPDCQRVWGEP